LVYWFIGLWLLPASSPPARTPRQAEFLVPVHTTWYFILSAEIRVPEVNVGKTAGCAIRYFPKGAFPFPKGVNEKPKDERMVK